MVNFARSDHRCVDHDRAFDGFDLSDGADVCRAANEDHGQVTGFLIVGGSTGGMIVPLLIGQMFESVGPRVMMFVVLIDLIVAVMVYLFLVLGSSPKYRTNLNQQEHSA